ncbi:FAD-dependent oxidoreductase [Paucibacter sp. PLA-PC-4]|uniref:FAD-dependent oxidoreductase n=1 Tax=Paucibacter sp. PLA-PC-4 TaxID=2993655 RepID=UPI0022493E42|nr:FAD-dependent oxidoreductase [Paucibacter sp. PLA-PC-4]MCX2861156.1 FAD-dependent oxidoreductase [Paucibacter sp. PLA-PC-4]
MLKTYTFPVYDYRQSPAQRESQVLRHPVVIIGAGPVGLTAALDCAARGIPVLLLDDNNSVSQGSRAVCYAKRSLEIWDRLGVGAGLAGQGVRWQVGKVFFRDELAYQFDLLPQPAHQLPAMINLQQYHLEERLVAACEAQPLITLEWKHKLVALDQGEEAAMLTVQTPDGQFQMEAQWLLACDGAGSDTRRMLGLDFEGQVFQDRFLIADVIMKADFPTERWFWFDPPFHRNQSVLLHKQCDGVWRIDFQLGRDADPAEEKKPEKVIPRIQAMLGPDVEFELEWVSVYQFACRRARRFRQGRVLLLGDAAHQVSPFGARGANSGVQDADNLGWKLKAVLEGAAPDSLLDSYQVERAAAADENILNSTRSTDFISPKSRASLRLRNAVLELAKTEAFARPLVNSGRLSMPTHYASSPLNTPDEDEFAGALRPGSPCLDAPLGEGWLLHQLGREFFTLLSFGPAEPVGVGTTVAVPLIVPADGLLAERYDARPGSVYLIRPDQHLAARWRRFDAAKIQAALRRCLGVLPS